MRSEYQVYGSRVGRLDGFGGVWFGGGGNTRALSRPDKPVPATSWYQVSVVQRYQPSRNGTCESTGRRPTVREAQRLQEAKFELPLVAGLPSWPGLNRSFFWYLAFELFVCFGHLLNHVYDGFDQTNCWLAKLMNLFVWLCCLSDRLRGQTRYGDAHAHMPTESLHTSPGTKRARHSTCVFGLNTRITLFLVRFNEHLFVFVHYSPMRVLCPKREYQPEMILLFGLDEKDRHARSYQLQTDPLTKKNAVPMLSQSIWSMSTVFLFPLETCCSHVFCNPTSQCLRAMVCLSILTAFALALALVLIAI